jgi:agmatinase
MIDPSFDPDAPATQAEGFFGLPHAAEDAAVVAIGVPFEATASFGRGTVGAPQAIYEASKQVQLNDLDTGEPWRAGLAMEPLDPAVTAWNEEASALAAPIIQAGAAQTTEQRAAVERVNAIGAELNLWLEKKTGALLDAAKIPAIIGGDHSVPFGAIQAAAKRNPKMGILHIDAHADCRHAYMGFEWSHASILYNVRNRIPRGHIVQVGIRDVGRKEAERIQAWNDLTAFTDTELSYELAAGEPWMRVAGRIVRPLPKDVWVTMDVDGLDPASAPNTGTPVPGGLRWNQLMMLLHVLAKNGHRIVGFDVCEVAAHPWDANVGARLVYKLAGWAIAQRAS